MSTSKNLVNSYEKKNIYLKNVLNRQFCTLTLEEQKTLFLIISQIDIRSEDSTKIKIEKTFLFKKLKVDGNSKYKRYRKIVKELADKTCFLIEGERGVAGINLFKSTKWRDDKSYFEVSINEEFMPLLLATIGNFTKFDLDTLLKFKSKHSLTLYRFIQSHYRNGKYQDAEIEEKDLKKLLGVSETSYFKNGKFSRSYFVQSVVDSFLEETMNDNIFKSNFVINKKSDDTYVYSFNTVPLSSNKEEKEPDFVFWTSFDD